MVDIGIYVVVLKFFILVFFFVYGWFESWFFDVVINCIFFGFVYVYVVLVIFGWKFGIVESNWLREVKFVKDGLIVFLYVKIYGFVGFNGFYYFFGIYWYIY